MAEKITIKEVKFAQKACADASAKTKEADNLNEIKAAAMMGIFERLLGVKSMDDVARCSPADIAGIAKRRLKRGDVELEGFDLELLLKVIKQSQCKRNVSWKDEFVKALGESKATEIINSTPERYSYKAVMV
jgi:hypothetical protein